MDFIGNSSSKLNASDKLLRCDTMGTPADNQSKYDYRIDLDCLLSLLNISPDWDESGLIFTDKVPRAKLLTFGLDLFSYVTPVVLVLGLIGNILSFAVFMTKTMRKVSASTYLAALSAADINTLVFYVLVEWLRRGLPHVNSGTSLQFLEAEGVCQIQLYISYISRFMSSWIVVAFTVERFVGVCYPLRLMRRKSRRVLLGLLMTGALLVLYKPILSGSISIGLYPFCGARKESTHVSFILDSMFGVVTYFLPLMIITILNLLIVRTLFLRKKRAFNLFNEVTKMRLEFTLILFVISFFFIAFNLPFFIVWFHMQITFQPGLHHEASDFWPGVMMITRTVFYLNFCSNFFLYSITGAYFRTELACLFRLRRRCQRTSNRNKRTCGGVETMTLQHHLFSSKSATNGT
ncbi:hypothetical protein DPMN_021497 [Dreissena polymorpha]|uniref:G-protein coupled receptors family 1 profile domain-containing protein n=1 Tax=Dreissena polymorpha TaxID=45954 RepID=A0A9D4NNV0_DREPO|nr:hypothetical protein DPMN_021497 [Dreissena polymorpha]